LNDGPLPQVPVFTVRSRRCSNGECTYSWTNVGKEGLAYETPKENDLMVSNEKPDFDREIDEKGT
jgi:hypothetical protein